MKWMVTQLIHSRMSHPVTVFSRLDLGARIKAVCTWL